MSGEAARKFSEDPDDPPRPMLRLFDVTEHIQRQIGETLSAREGFEALCDAEVMSSEPYNRYDLYVIASQRPLVRGDLINAKTKLQEAVILTGTDLDNLLDAIGDDLDADCDHFTIIDAHGRPIRIFRGCIPEGCDLIIFPDDLGDEEGKPRLNIG